MVTVHYCMICDYCIIVVSFVCDHLNSLMLYMILGFVFINMFTVIQFSPSQGGSVALVSSNWLTPRKKEVYWPPYKEQKKFNRSVKQSEEINTNTWGLFNVERIFYESDNYDKAFQKLKRAEITSDVQTDDLEEEEFSIKRKCIRPLRFGDSSDESEEERRFLPAPPLIKKSVLKAASCSSTAAVGSSTKIRSPSACVTPSIQTPTGGCTLSEKSGFQVLLENIVEVKNQNKLILGHLSKLLEKEKHKEHTLPEVPVTFPIVSVENLRDLENFLNDAENFNSMVAYFSGLGGNNITSKTNKILKLVISDTLASQYNYFGRNRKQPFKDLKLSTCILDAVKLSCTCTSSEVESCIKVWLKHANQRLKNKEGRK